MFWRLICLRFNLVSLPVSQYRGRINDGMNNGIFGLIYNIGDNNNDATHKNNELGMYIKIHKPLWRFIALCTDIIYWKPYQSFISTSYPYEPIDIPTAIEGI